jgi:transcriptional regulator with XRE-family HTH domain
LQRAFTHKGWNQSELARRAAVYVPEGGMGRDVISTYVRGKSLPGPIHLTAICKALGVEPDDLLPSRGMPSAGADSPPLDMRDIGEGKVWLRINQSVDWSVAVRIINVLKGE